MSSFNDAIQSALDTLTRLAEIDQNLHRLDQELHDKPAAISATEADIRALRAQIGAVDARRTASQGAQQRLEAELADVEKRRKRAGERLAALTTAQQIATTEREIADLGVQASALESDVLEGLDALDSINAEGKDLSTRLAKAQERLTEQQQHWSARGPIASAERQTWAAQRENTVPALPADILRTYQIGLGDKRFPPPAGLTRVEGNTCVTCHTRPPPLWLQESRQRRALHACEGCRRILLVDPAPTPA